MHNDPGPNENGLLRLVRGRTGHTAAIDCKREGRMAPDSPASWDRAGRQTLHTRLRSPSARLTPLARHERSEPLREALRDSA
jgi:hypothetical protein